MTPAAIPVRKNATSEAYLGTANFLYMHREAYFQHEVYLSSSTRSSQFYDPDHCLWINRCFLPPETGDYKYSSQSRRRAKFSCGTSTTHWPELNATAHLQLQPLFWKNRIYVKRPFAGLWVPHMQKIAASTILEPRRRIIDTWARS